MYSRRQALCRTTLYQQILARMSCWYMLHASLHQLISFELFSGGSGGSSTHVKGNLARGKRTFQSSTAHGGSSGRAVDGKTSSNYNSRSCTHTKAPGRKVWGVNLVKEYSIKKVIIYNRMDCCSQRLVGSRVHVTNDKQAALRGPLSDHSLCGTITDRYPKDKIMLSCKGRQGRYVVIEKTDTTALTLCEVQVFGSQMQCKFIIT